MRAILRWASGLLAVAACHNHRPAVMPNLMAVPEDKLDAVIQTSLSRPTAEQQPATAQGRDIETFAAEVAASLGMTFSHDENASFGLAWDDVGPPKRPTLILPPSSEGTDPSAKPPPLVPDGGVLVPWVQLKP